MAQGTRAQEHKTQEADKIRVSGKRFFLFLSVAVFLTACSSKKEGSRVCFRKNCFSVEIVQKEEQRAKGLQFRKSLSQDCGMLFVFPQVARHSFWMQDTLIPLDIIWLDHGRRVVHLEENVPPCRQSPCPVYAPSAEALYVLEVNAGVTKEKGIKNGDLAEFRLSQDFLGR